MSVFESEHYDDHELVKFIHDYDSGLKAIIAVHDTARGPGCGGCRLWPYASSAEALDDVLRLSKGMSYKNALADLPIGGGKAVIIARREDKTPGMMQAFGRFVEELNGLYITAEDVGTNVEDMREVSKHTSHVGGLPRHGDIGGDPSPNTARGVYNAMRAAWRFHSGSDDLRGVRVLVQGVGNVGYHLCRLLGADGARIFACDQNEARIVEIGAGLDIGLVAPEEAYSSDVDIFSPCAMGAVLNETTIPRITAKVVAGAANNQLAKESDGDLLVKRGILYAPDYVINSGGIISVWSEFSDWSAKDVTARIDRIYDITTKILDRSSQTAIPTHRVADQLAREVLDAGKPRSPNRGLS